MSKFSFTELVDSTDYITARLGSGTGAAGVLSDADVGKLVKLAGDSRYDLAAVGNEIEGRIASLNAATQDGYSIGSVATEGRFAVTADGLQATPGTGVLAVGDYVVTGTPTAKGIKLTAPAKVCKATAAGSTLNFKCRVVGLGPVGTGVVGTTVIIESVL